MKRIILLTVIIQLTGFIFAQNQEIIIREVTGTVELKAPGSADWVSAQVGDRLEQSTIISTSFNSTARISVGNSSILVRSLTRLSLQAVIDMENTENVGLELRTGRVRVDVNPSTGSKANYTVRTPLSLASVRGTSFEIDPFNITVMSGTVRFEPLSRAAFQPVLVNANQSSWVESDTGNARNPLTVAEESRSLPSLPGQEAVQDVTGRGSNDGGSDGSLDLVINVN